MPAEWESHAATWLAWPHFRGDWPGKFEPIPWVYAEIIRYLSRHEQVELIVKDAAAEKLARKTLKRAHALDKNVRFHRWPTNRVWTRDSGCAFVRQTSGAKAPSSEGAASARLEAVPFHEPEGCLAAIKWRFNAWAKYPNWKHDEQIGRLMAHASGAQEFRPMFEKNRMVLEGGSIEVNGRGSLITTEECLLSRVQQRNPGMKKKDYEKVFAEYLGATNVIWLGSGIVGDDTHGHVDDIRISAACATRPPKTVSLSRPLISRCRLRCISKAGGCLQATRISILPTALFSCRCSTIRMTASPSTFLRIFFPIVKLFPSIVEI